MRLKMRFQFYVNENKIEESEHATTYEAMIRCKAISLERYRNYNIDSYVQMFEVSETKNDFICAYWKGEFYS